MDKEIRPSRRNIEEPEISKRPMRPVRIGEVYGFLGLSVSIFMHMGIIMLYSLALLD